MICPNCDTTNPAGAKFCNNCGTRLPAGCPACGTINPSGAKFCNNCGRSLTGTPSDPQVSSVEREPSALDPYIPDEVQARLGRARAHSGVEGERRIVTILFCDVKGSTAAASTLDPEEWTEIINGAFEYMIQPVYTYDGTVARLTGDGILAFFGAPVAHEDDPQRAVLAGLAIIAGVQRYRESVRTRWGIDFSVRVGINTGLVVVGAVGSTQRMEYTAMGDAINIAARMEQTADPNTVRIARDTYQQVAQQFDVEELGRIAIRGKEAPVEAYRVLGPRPGAMRRRHISRAQTPLIGRDWELRALEQAVVRVLQGQGGIVCVVGEAGMGKSRLLHEAAQFWRRSTESDHWYVTGSLSYETGVPYAQFQRLLRQGAGVSPTDSAEAVRGKLTVFVDAFPADQQPQARQVFEQVLGVPPLNGNHPLEGELFKEALFATILHLSRAWAAEGPMVLVLDDLQWTDPASVELLIHLFQLAEQAGILFLCTTRIEREAPGWQVTAVARQEFSRQYTEIWLHALSQSHSEQLMESLAGPAGLAAPLREQIVRKTEGNPLFVEELVLSILEESGEAGGAHGGQQAADSDDDIEIPDTLQALLLSRVDRLDEDARYVVQLASVIGYQFHRKVLREIVASSLDIDRQLATLLQHELVREIAPAPERVLAFRHALIQDAVYQSILRSQRRIFHLRVAEALQALFPDRQTEFAALLAHHLAEGGDTAAAIACYTKAGDTAAGLYANAEAVAHYSEALKLARGHETPPQDMLHLYRSRGRSLDMLGRHAEAAENYEMLQALGKQLGDRSMELAGLAGRAALYAIPTDIHDPARSRELAEQALPLAREVGDHEAEARLLWNLLLASKFAGTPGEAIAFGEASLAIARQYNLRQQMAYTLNDLGIFAYVDAGRTDDALATLRQALPLWIELGNRPMQADNLSGTAIIQFMKGDFRQASATADEALSISQQIGNLWGQSYSQWTVGDVLFERGQWGAALDRMQNCIDLATRAGFTGAAVGVGSSRAFVYGVIGAVEEALVQVRAVRRLAEEGLSGWLVWPLSVEVQLLLKTGRVDEAAEIMGRVDALFASGRVGSYLPTVGLSVNMARGRLALAQGDLLASQSAAATLADYMKRASIRVFMPDSHFLSAETLLRLGKPEQAVEQFVRAIEIARSIGSRRSLWQGLSALSAIEDDLGLVDQASAHRSEARELHAYIIGHLQDSDLRAVFLEQSGPSRSS
ncbi:MAG TPA: adenylate/guanylate cyclase domain-containing protein [Anaerolineae bacterium]|nr:adenylate/guanylate cyclase domain-containing protein [Anaerolineae bacterium]